MTVEMKVRFKIKEEETIKWTTTVSRAGLSGDKNITICNAAMGAEDCLSNVNISERTKPMDTSFLDSYNKEDGDSLKQFNEEVSGKESESDLKMDGCNIHQKSKSADLAISNVPKDNIRPRFYRPPTPGPRRVRQKKAVVESVTLVSEKEVQEKTIGQFSYSEEIQNGENKSEYCMVAHSSRKKSSVSNPKFSEMSDNDILKLSSENIKEEMVFKVSQKSHDLIGTTNRKTLDVPDDNELVQNILEKSVVEQGAYNSLVSTCKANISGFTPSSKNYQTARPVSADHIHELCDIKQIKRSLSSYIRYSELSQSKNEERKCKASNLLAFSQDSVHSVCPGHNKMEKMIASCSKAPTEKINPTTAFSPVTESENLISVRAESVTASHLIDESQSASSLTKKKKRKLLSNFLEKGIYENQKDKEISGIIKSEEVLVTSKTTQVSTTQDNCSEMLQKKEMELLVKSNDGSDNSDKSICPEDEFYPHNSAEQNRLSPNEKTRTKKWLAEVKSKSGKKNSSLLSGKSEDDLMTVDSKNETESSQDAQSTVKEGKHLTTNSIEQTPNLAMISKTLSEMPKVHKIEKGREDNILENLSLKKEKKQKKMRKNLSKGANKLNMSESSITVEALKQENFQEEIVEHSLENYVQTWLKNLSPNAVLPPIKKKEGSVENSDVCHVSKENTDAFIDKEAKFITNKMHVTGKKHLFEHNQTKKTLKPLFELGTLEESSKHSRQNQTDSLICGNTTMVEESKYLLQSEFHHDSQLHLFHETHGNDKKVSESDIQDTNLCHRKKSEVAVQVDCSIVSEKVGTDTQNNCMSSMLLHELQSTLLGLQKEHTGCIGKTYSLSDISPPVFGSSSNLLLAWLLVLNLRESLIGTTKDDMQKATCSCSEVITQLQFLKQATVMQKVDELKAAFSHFQETTENNLLHSAKEFKKQDSTYCHENIHILENHNDIHLHEEEKSVEPCIAKNSLNSEEALTLSSEFESYSDIQKELCRATEISDLSASKTQLDGQYADTNSIKCNLSSAIEPSETNEEMAYNLYEKPHDKNINEESDTSVEPNSTVHSVTSNDKNCILDQDTSEIEGEKYIVDVTTDQREDEKVDPKSTGNDEKTNSQLKLVADTSAEYNYEDCSVQEGKEDTETCEETSERLSTVSPLSFCYESKQITECDMSEGEQKLQVEELENRTCSDTSQLKKCLKSPATSDWSDYRPDTEESDYNFRASSDLTNESGEEAVLEKHYNTSYVKRTIERLYGKTEASFKPDFQKGFPYMSKALQKDTEEFSSAVVKKNIQFFQEPRPCFAEKFSHSSLSSQEFPEIINKDETTWRKEHISSPTPQPTPNGEETNYINDYSGEPPKQHCQPSVHANEDEGILIDKGKWLLKENHLIRRSPPERTGMYGNLDTTSTDTVLDTNSDDAPYSHFGNLNPVLNEISSSELEDMAKPSKNFCNYFNIPHSSDSDPLQDDLSRESKPGLNGKITSLPVGNKEKIKPSVMVGSASTHLSREADTNFPAFTSVEFRLPDNKVHPLEQPLNDEPIQSQPTDVNNTNRNALQEDSLDKLHAICGQHCPILMVMVTPINENQRGYAYQKASDIENQMGLCLLASKSEHLQWLGKDLVKDENNYVTLKRNFINKIANNIFTRYYANNTIDFISNIGILTSSTLKDKSNLRRLHGIKNMNLKPMEVSNCQNKVSKHIPSDYMVDTKSKPPNTKPKICQILRISPIHIVGEKLSPLLTDPAETCHSEIFLKCDTFINNIERTAFENMKNANAFSTEEEEGGGGRRGEGGEGEEREGEEEEEGEGEEGEEEEGEGEGEGGGGGGEEEEEEEEEEEFAFVPWTIDTAKIRKTCNRDLGSSITSD
ncbi:oxygen-regulated protein 1-like [Anser cygnoides]|uniref:oxygen-regulated protein 1-like n=1 Tax=Anser cygnoides TaxID=8845 RepID=UPI0034D32C4E